jgi:ankyrin repeat protein
MGMTYTEDQKQLIAASRGGDLEALERLIANGVNVDCELKYGASALMLTAARGHVDIIRRLVAAGAKLNRRNRFGATALLEACEKAHLEAIKVLVQLGAEINLPHNNGNTPLLAATMRRDRKVIKMLLELGADPEVKNFAGWSARSWAEAEADSSIQALFGIKKVDHDLVHRNEEMAKLDEAAQQKKSAGVGHDTFWTVLMRAASAGDLETVRRLANDGVEVNGQSPNGTTPLMAAVKNGHAETALELVELGADLGLADTDGMTAIEWAKQKGQVMIVKALETRQRSEVEHSERVEDSSSRVLA